MGKLEFLTAIFIGIVLTAMLFPAPVPKTDHGKIVIGSWDTNWDGPIEFRKDGTCHHSMRVQVSGAPAFIHDYKGTWKMTNDGILKVEESDDGFNICKWHIEFGRTLTGKLVGQVEGDYGTRFLTMKRK